MASTRYESSVTAISWIPSEAITGPSKVPFQFGVTHYDQAPPDHIDDLDEMRRSDRFREANELRAFIEVEDGRIVAYGHLGKGHIGATTVRVGPAALRFPAVQLPDIQPAPEVSDSSVLLSGGSQDTRESCRSPSHRAGRGARMQDVGRLRTAGTPALCPIERTDPAR